MPIDERNQTRDLCKFLAELGVGAIPHSTLERTKDLMLDHLGVAVYGATLPWAHSIRSYVQARETGIPESTVYGSPQKASRRAAAFVNGTASHGSAMDDTDNGSFSHPGSVVFSAALAVAEAVDATGDEFLAAVVAGYEAQCRIGTAAASVLSRGFNPTPLFGVFAAAAAAGRLMRLNAEQLESAFGLAASMSSGLMQFSQDPGDTMVKRLHAAMPAQNGVMSAELAASGFHGPRAAVDGRFGFLPVYAGTTDASGLTRDLGVKWACDDIGIKMYPCCRHFHSIIEALQDCRARHPFDVSEIERVDVSTAAVAVEGRVTYRPRSVVAAQYSFPYAVAATVLLDPMDPKSFGEPALSNPALEPVMDRVKVHADPELDKLLPDKWAGGVAVTLKDGTRLDSLKIDFLGSSGMPLSRDAIAAKFSSMTTGVATKEWQRSIEDAVLSLDARTRVRDISALLGAIPAPSGR